MIFVSTPIPSELPRKIYHGRINALPNVRLMAELDPAKSATFKVIEAHDLTTGDSWVCGK